MIEERARAMEAMLAACGELGYPNVMVRHVLERSGCSRVLFYRLFEGKADCYARAYKTEIERLCDALLGAARKERSWRAGLRTALSDLALYVNLRPTIAKGLLVEVHSAGNPSLKKRVEIVERAARAIDHARGEAGAIYSPPSIAAEFLVCAIESTAVRALTKGEPASFAAAVPDLAHLVVTAYFGKEAARQDMAAFQK